jgi:hypothetical protein
MQRKRKWWSGVSLVGAAVLLLSPSGCSVDAEALAYNFATGILDAVLAAVQNAVTTGLTSGG